MNGYRRGEGGRERRIGRECLLYLDNYVWLCCQSELPQLSTAKSSKTKEKVNTDRPVVKKRNLTLCCTCLTKGRKIR